MFRGSTSWEAQRWGWAAWELPLLPHPVFPCPGPLARLQASIHSSFKGSAQGPTSLRWSQSLGR